MKQGFIPVVVIVLISVLALGLAGAAWYYEVNKEDVAATSTINTSAVNLNTNVNSAANTNLASNTNTLAVDTSNWQTYTYNGEYSPFSIKYPKAGEVIRHVDEILDPEITTGIKSCVLKYNESGLGRGLGFVPLSIDSLSIEIEGDIREMKRWTSADTGKLKFGNVIIRDDKSAFIELYYPENENNEKCENIIIGILSSYKIIND